MSRRSRRSRTIVVTAITVACGWPLAAQPARDSLRFYPDSGIRVDQASNPEAGVDPLTSVVYLYYEDRQAQGPGPRERVALSVDGLEYQPGSVPRDHANDPRRVLLPDGNWRMYQLSRAMTLTSTYSTDGVSFVSEPGIRYALAPEDRGSMGIYELFADSSGGIVMLYLGDLLGSNNTRRAYSRDNGLSFQFERGDVLGDAALGGGARSHVDLTSILLPDGRRRLFTMQGGNGTPQIHSFVSSDEGRSFAQEPGPRVSSSDWTEFPVFGLYDPTIVRLPDGRYRMYVCGQVDEPAAGGRGRSVILSASTR